MHIARARDAGGRPRCRRQAHRLRVRAAALARSTSAWRRPRSAAAVVLPFLPLRPRRRRWRHQSREPRRGRGVSRTATGAGASAPAFWLPAPRISAPGLQRGRGAVVRHPREASGVWEGRRCGSTGRMGRRAVYGEVGGGQVGAGASAKGGGEKEENKAGALARPEVFVLWFGSI